MFGSLIRAETPRRHRPLHRQQKSRGSSRYVIVHNIGEGPEPGRRPFPLGNHRPLSVLWAGFVEILLFLPCLALQV